MNFCDFGFWTLWTFRVDGHWARIVYIGVVYVYVFVFAPLIFFNITSTGSCLSCVGLFAISSTLMLGVYGSQTSVTVFLVEIYKGIVTEWWPVRGHTLQEHIKSCELQIAHFMSIKWKCKWLTLENLSQRRARM